MKNSRDQSPEIIINHWAEHLNNGNLESWVNRSFVLSTISKENKP